MPKLARAFLNRKNLTSLSWKSTTNHPRPTIRCNGRHEGVKSSTSHLSTPAEVRRKSPSKLRRDRRRIQERYLLSKEDVPACLNRTESKTKQTPMIDKTRITKPSELDLGLTLSRSDRPSQQELCVSPKYTVLHTASTTFDCNMPSDAYQRKRLYRLL
ncbi:hypothetical protein ElyMa_004187300 [Elysia marginata]|uniref:Uncharacterized protein n=1 Tax=Elysia marginata TaxID=1093978 RepID=A0AAV4GK93_9GAST|nr:hypothetical protein ElyMa_004187300 [Elysia marginata]